MIQNKRYADFILQLPSPSVEQLMRKSEFLEKHDLLDKSLTRLAVFKTPSGSYANTGEGLGSVWLAPVY